MDSATFLRTFQNVFSKADLRGLCFDLQFDPENVEHEVKDDFALNLILVCQKHDKLTQLVVLCREKRPTRIWPSDEEISNITLNDPQEINSLEIKMYLEWVRKTYSNMRVLIMIQSLADTYTDVFLLEKEKYWREEGQESLEQTLSQRKTAENSKKRIAGKEILNRFKRLFVVGKMGAGKTTFSKWLALHFSKAVDNTAKIPIYVALRRFNSWDSDLVSLLVKELAACGIAEANSKIENLLQQSKLLILLDGLDEVQTQQRQRLNDQIDDLTKSSGDCQIVITCRPHAETRRFQQYDYVELANFTDTQVDDFIQSWFRAKPQIGLNLRNVLRHDKHKNIRELAKTPLYLALLCISFQESKTFPEKLHELHARALKVALDQWDKERGVQRDSAYGSLSLERKKALLAKIAYETFSEGQLLFSKERLSLLIKDFWQDWLRQEVLEYKALGIQPLASDLPTKNVDTEIIINEIIVHGLLVEQLPDVYSFSHLTFQEFFTAQFVVDNEENALLQLVKYVGEDSWREIFLLTAGMSIVGDNFVKQYIASLTKLIKSDDSLLAYLVWLAEKCQICAPNIQQVQARIVIFFRALARPFDFALALLVGGNKDLPIQLRFDLAHMLDFSKVKDRWEPVRFMSISQIRDIDSLRDNARAEELGRMLGLGYLTSINGFDLPFESKTYIYVGAYLALTETIVYQLNSDGTFGIRFNTYESVGRAISHILLIDLIFDLAVSYDIALLDHLTKDLEKNIQALQAWSRQQNDLPVWLLDSIANLAFPTGQEKHSWERTWSYFSGKMQQIFLRYWKLEQFWHFNKQQVEVLRKYIFGTKVLVECLDVANVKDKAAIKAQLLLPQQEGLS